jgi:hypothetical protein
MYHLPAGRLMETVPAPISLSVTVAPGPVSVIMWVRVGTSSGVTALRAWALPAALSCSSGSPKSIVIVPGSPDQGLKQEPSAVMLKPASAATVKNHNKRFVFIVELLNAAILQQVFLKKINNHEKLIIQKTYREIAGKSLCQ